MARSHQPHGCSFCGKGRDQTQRLIAGPNGVAICSECVALCNQILAETLQTSAALSSESASAVSQPDRPAWRSTSSARDADPPAAP